MGGVDMWMCGCVACVAYSQAVIYVCIDYLDLLDRASTRGRSPQNRNSVGSVVSC